MIMILNLGQIFCDSLYNHCFAAILKILRTIPENLGNTFFILGPGMVLETRLKQTQETQET